MLEMGIKPVWVFDGVPSQQKSLTVELRRTRNANFALECEKAIQEGRVKDVMKYSKRSFSLSVADKDSCQVLLESLGATIVHAQEEADLAIGTLSRDFGINMCFSEDSDLLVHGVDSLIRSDRTETKESGSEV